jgi:archaellum component FlaC
MGVQLLAKIHCLESQLRGVDHRQNHPVNRMVEYIDFIGDASNCVGGVVDELNGRIDAQDVQIEQLANMVNDLVGRVEGQAKEIKLLKTNCKEHHKVINMMTAKVIALEQYTEDIQKKVFPQVGGGEQLGFRHYH